MKDYLNSEISKYKKDNGITTTKTTETVIQDYKTKYQSMFGNIDGAFPKPSLAQRKLIETGLMNKSFTAFLKENGLASLSPIMRYASGAKLSDAESAITGLLKHSPHAIDQFYSKTPTHPAPTFKVPTESFRHIDNGIVYANKWYKDEDYFTEHKNIMLRSRSKKRIAAGDTREICVSYRKPHEKKRKVRCFHLIVIAANMRHVQVSTSNPPPVPIESQMPDELIGCRYSMLLQLTKIPNVVSSGMNGLQKIESVVGPDVQCITKKGTGASFRTVCSTVIAETSKRNCSRKVHESTVENNLKEAFDKLGYTINSLDSNRRYIHAYSTDKPTDIFQKMDNQGQAGVWYANLIEDVESKIAINNILYNAKITPGTEQATAEIAKRMKRTAAPPPPTTTPKPVTKQTPTNKPAGVPVKTPVKSIAIPMAIKRNAAGVPVKLPVKAFAIPMARKEKPVSVPIKLP